MSENLDKSEYDSFLAFTSECGRESDRAAVILGAAKLDVLLYHAIQSVLIATPTADDPLFDGDAPLSTFSAKIVLAYRIGLIDAEFARALHIVRRIRNAFAHEMANSSLSSGPHADHVRELVSPFKKFASFDFFIHSFFPNQKGPGVEFRTVLAIMVSRLQDVGRTKVCLASKTPRALINDEWDKVLNETLKKYTNSNT